MSSPRNPLNPLYFAPMEGVTDASYRLAMLRNFPEWDYFSTDFLRVPTVGRLSKEKVINHFGCEILQNKHWKEKTIFQILTTARAQTTQCLEILKELDLRHLDLNLGCPSKKVNAHGGGASLLAKLSELKDIVRLIRSHYPFHFSVKIRIGYKDHDNFEDLIKLFCDEGVDLITIHGRTQSQLYKGNADWSFIKKAVELSSVPIIGNGDIWDISNIDEILDYTGCQGVMLGRSALKTPWLAHYYQKIQRGNQFINEEFIHQERIGQIQLYFESLEKEYRKKEASDQFILGRFKSFSRYLFEDLKNGEALRSSLVRSQGLTQFKEKIYSL